MTPEQILFIIVGAITIIAGFMVVVARNLVHAALWLVLSLFGVAIFYVMLDAGFLAAAQVVIYIGAIAILMIFAIMLTQGVAKENKPQVNPNWGWGAALTALLFVGLIWMLKSWSGFFGAAPLLASDHDSLRQLGMALVSPNGFVLPFELASVLLLAALIGAIIVAWDKK
jgi:NADH-quinone oxidoreductase subunit J